MMNHHGALVSCCRPFWWRLALVRLGKVDSTHVIKRVNSVTAEMVIQSLRYGIKAWLKMDPACIKELLD